MAAYKYLIVGGGMTADAAVRGIRKVDESGSIGLFSLETDSPYNRPILSKGLWKGKPVEKAWRGTEQFGVDLHLGVGIQTLDADKRCVTDSRGMVHTFDQLLLATGGKPRQLPYDVGGIIYYRTMEDYRQLRQETEEGQTFAVIGGGFIGSEIAAALAMNGKKVTMIFPEEAIGARVYPADIASFLNDYYRQKGVEVLAGEMISTVEKHKGQFVLKTLSGAKFQVDGVVAGLGIQPNVELAQQAGLAIDSGKGASGGIVVSPSLETSHPNIFAAGDVAAFYNPALGVRMRVEHEDNANTMGMFAGQAMAGQTVNYDYLPYFYSDLFELGYEAVGQLNPQLETFADWKVPYQKGVIYYLKDARVRGVLLWDTWSQVDSARKLIAEPGPFTPEDLKGKI